MGDNTSMEITDQHQAIIDHWTDERQQVAFARALDDGTLIIVYPFLTTWGLCYDMGEMEMGGRFCFKTLGEALGAAVDYKGRMFEIPEDAIRVKGIDTLYLIGHNRQTNQTKVEGINDPDSRSDQYARSQDHTDIYARDRRNSTT